MIPDDVPLPGLALNRSGLMCANPKCWFLVNESPEFGGYCCKKCRWRETSTSKKKKDHGVSCSQIEAPEGARRAPRVAPLLPDSSPVVEPMRSPDIAVERDRCRPTLVAEQVLPAMPMGRAGLMCANPKCWLLVHKREDYGGYCCKKCHWRHTNGSKSKNCHGVNCLLKSAPDGAPRAPPVPPNEPMRQNTSTVDDMNKDVGSHLGGNFAQAAPPPPPPEPTHGSRIGPALWRACERDQIPIDARSRRVRIVGFVQHTAFNGLIADIYAATDDGRYDLRLADGAKLRSVKRINIEAA